MNSLIHKLVKMKIAAKLAENPENFDEESIQLVEEAKTNMETLTKEKDTEMSC